jgi:hypothetical protein
MRHKRAKLIHDVPHRLSDRPIDLALRHRRVESFQGIAPQATERPANSRELLGKLIQQNPHLQPSHLVLALHPLRPLDHGLSAHLLSLRAKASELGVAVLSESEFLAMLPDGIQL